MYEIRLKIILSCTVTRVYAIINYTSFSRVIYFLLIIKILHVEKLHLIILQIYNV